MIGRDKYSSGSSKRDVALSFTYRTGSKSCTRIITGAGSYYDSCMQSHFFRHFQNTSGRRLNGTISQFQPIAVRFEKQTM